MNIKPSVVKGSIVVAATAFPVITLAVGNLSELVGLVLEYFNLAIYFIMALAVLLFIWNVFRYFFKADGDKTEAGKYVMYSVIGFAVMFTFWGLVNLVINTVRLDNTNPPGINVPTGSVGIGGGAGVSKPTLYQRLTGSRGVTKQPTTFK
ncbi:MAG: hypothetical protein V4526_00625 [Patescibacteria group bacterium]